MSSDLTRLRKCFQPRQWFFCEDDIEVSDLNDEVIFMYTYRPLGSYKDDPTALAGEGEIFLVGFFMPDKTWYTESSFKDRKSAARRVNYLNGGHAHGHGEG